MVSCIVRAMKTSKEKKQSRGGERAEPGATLGWWEGLRGERPREGTCGLRLKQQQGARQAKAGKGELPSVNILITCEISRLEEQKCGGPAAVCLAERARERGGGEGRKGDRFGHEAPVSQTHPGTGPGPAHLSQQPGGLVGTLAGQVGTWGLTLPSDS